jgi:hypothetical protein
MLSVACYCPLSSVPFLLFSRSKTPKTQFQTTRLGPGFRYPYSTLKEKKRLAPYRHSLCFLLLPRFHFELPGPSFSLMQIDLRIFNSQAESARTWRRRRLATGVACPSAAAPDQVHARGPADGEGGVGWPLAPLELPLRSRSRPSHDPRVEGRKNRCGACAVLECLSAFSFLALLCSIPGFFFPCHVCLSRNAGGRGRSPVPWAFWRHAGQPRAASLRRTRSAYEAAGSKPLCRTLIGVAGWPSRSSLRWAGTVVDQC